MVTRVGINGFGRIGRLVTRVAFENQVSDLQIVAVNGTSDSATNSHLLKYDSSFGVFKGVVEPDNDDLVIDGNHVRIFSEKYPKDIPWSEYGVDIVVECTGKFTDAEQARGHIDAGASKVVISALAKNPDLTMVLGVNDGLYDPKEHSIVSNASCTTNCFAPMVKVLHENFGVEKGLMSTIHSYTNDQSILDRRHSDLRRARAAAQNIIPTSTGAAKSVGIVLPELNGKLHGIDINEDLIKIAKKKYQSVSTNISLDVADYDDFNPLGKMYDWIFSIYSIYYTQDPEDLIHNLFKSMSSGAKFVITGPSSQNALELDEINLAVTGKKRNKEDIRRMHRIEEDFLLVFKKIFSEDKTSLEFINTKMSFPTSEEFAIYYWSTLLWRESITGLTNKEISALKSKTVEVIEQMPDSVLNKQMSCLVGMK